MTRIERKDFGGRLIRLKGITDVQLKLAKDHMDQKGH